VPLFAALARASDKHMCDFKPQHLANTAWAFATACQVDGRLCVALARASEEQMRDFTFQGLANTAWAFAAAA